MLHEFYYGLEIGGDVLAKINARAVTSANALAASPIWQALQASETEIVSCEQFDTFLIGGKHPYMRYPIYFLKTVRAGG